MADEPYFTAAELRTHAGGIADITDAAIDLKRQAVEATIERVCGTSFVARTHVDTVVGAGAYGLTLSRQYTRSLVSVMVDGVALAPLATTVRLTLDDVLEHRLQPWATDAVVVVTYLAGALPTPPADLKEAAMEATRIRLHENRTAGVPSRALSISNEFGNVNLASASLARPFGIPDVDAVVLGYAQAYRVPVTA